MKYPLPQHMHISIMERSCMVRPCVCRMGSGHARLNGQVPGCSTKRG